MAKTTTTGPGKFVKQDYDEFADIDDYNDSLDTIDALFSQVVAGTDIWLIQAALATAFLLTGDQTYDATFGTLMSSSIEWPDGAPGVFTTTGLDGNGAATGFTATYQGATGHLVTVVIPRNTNGQVNGLMSAVVTGLGA